MNRGIAFIISNPKGRKHRGVFEDLCNKSIAFARQHLSLPIVVVMPGESDVKADHYIDATPYLNKYKKMGDVKELHGLIAAELIKTHICEWSPFDQTLYIDCDAFIMHRSAKDYLSILDAGYQLSVATCVTMAWKDSIADTSVRKEIFGKIPSCFPYWNFGVFGVSKSSDSLMIKIREEFLRYCFGGNNKFGSCPHAQPAIVRAAYALSPNHGIFTMPAKYNCHFAGAGGYAFSGSPVILHMWKDIREMMLKGY